MARPLSSVLIGWLYRSETTRREIFLAWGFLFLVMVAGTVGYRMIEQWSWLDCAYMTFITVTTIGFSEVASLSPTGRVFTMAVGLIGIGSVAFIATRSAQLLLTGQKIRALHMTRQISQLVDHYIICGFGRIGGRIAQDLYREERPFVLVDNDEDMLEIAIASKFLLVQGDAQDEDVLRMAGIDRAKGLILTLPEDSANVFVTLTAREAKPELFILVRTDTLKNKRKLLRAGADKVVAAYEIGADRMAQVILRPRINQFLEEVLQSDGLDLSIQEVAVQQGSMLAGESLSSSSFKSRFDAIVLAIHGAASQKMQFNPSATTVINPGDILIVLGAAPVIERLKLDGCEPA